MNNLSKEELEQLHTLRYKSAVKQRIAELEARLSELEEENKILKMYLKYGLSEKDQINPETGEIIKYQPEIKIEEENNE